MHKNKDNAQNSWQTYFDGVAATYMQEEYAQPWREEVDFYLDLLKLAPPASLLDLGCGPGRHAVEFARRGYRVTALDFSAAMVQETARAAQQAGVELTLIQADATAFSLPEPVDVVLCMLEAGIGFVNLDQDPYPHDIAILTNVNRALKPGGRFLLGVPNTWRFLRHYDPTDPTQGTFDPVTMILEHDATWTTADGTETAVRVRIREYLPTELQTMLQATGFVVEHMWGGTCERRPLDPDDYIMTIVAHKIEPLV